MEKLILMPIKLLTVCLICSMIMLLGCAKDPDLNSEKKQRMEQVKDQTQVREQLRLDSANCEPVCCITDDEISSLSLQIEEEKLARDVYYTMFNLWNMNILENFSESEENHVEALLKLINKYELDNPIDGYGIGLFENAMIQNRYDSLVASGTISVFNALMVGLSITESDIENIQYDLDYVVERNDITQVYSNLLEASMKHLDALNEKLDQLTQIP